MTYMRQWRGKTEPEDKSGEADYMIEGELFSIPLPSFEHAQRLDALLWTAFRQGKAFAFRAVKDHIADAVQRADTAHSLTMTT